MLWYRYRQVPGRQNRLPLADSGGAHVFKEPSCAKDGPQSCQYGFSCLLASRAQPFHTATAILAALGSIFGTPRLLKHMYPSGICQRQPVLPARYLPVPVP